METLKIIEEAELTSATDRTKLALTQQVKITMESAKKVIESKINLKVTKEVKNMTKEL